MSKLTIIQIIALLVTLLGVINLLNAADMGYSSAQDFLGPGPFDMTSFNELTRGYTQSYQLLGAIFTFSGLIGLLLSTLKKI